MYIKDSKLKTIIFFEITQATSQGTNEKMY